MLYLLGASTPGRILKKKGLEEKKSLNGKGKGSLPNRDGQTSGRGGKTTKS